MRTYLKDLYTKRPIIALVLTSLISVVLVLIALYIFPPKKLVVDNNVTRIICNVGNKKAFFASETGITFTVADFKQQRQDLSKDKVDAIIKLCNFTKQESFKFLDAFSKAFFKYPEIFDVMIPQSMYTVEPAYKYVY